MVNAVRLFAILCWTCGAAASFGVELRRDDQASQLSVLLDGREVVVYQYGAEYALPHYWPLRSPSGKLLTVEHPDPYPHHRSVWIADHIHAAGAPPVDFYHCWKNYRQAGVPESGFRHFIRHQRFTALKSHGDTRGYRGDAALDRQRHTARAGRIPPVAGDRTWVTASSGWTSRGS